MMTKEGRSSEGDGKMKKIVHQLEARDMSRENVPKPPFSRDVNRLVSNPRTTPYICKTSMELFLNRFQDPSSGIHGKTRTRVLLNRVEVDTDRFHRLSALRYSKGHYIFSFFWLGGQFFDGIRLPCAALSVNANVSAPGPYGFSLPCAALCVTADVSAPGSLS